MSTYRYRLIADIEVDAPNVVAAKKAVSANHKIRGFGSYMGGVRLPSQRRDEPRCRVEVRVDHGTIERRAGGQAPGEIKL